MITKFVCMVKGCEFVSEDPQEAMEHVGSHPNVEDAQIAEVGQTDEGVIDCSTFTVSNAEPAGDLESDMGDDMDSAGSADLEEEDEEY